MKKVIEKIIRHKQTIEDSIYRLEETRSNTESAAEGAELYNQIRGLQHYKSGLAHCVRVLWEADED